MTQLETIKELIKKHDTLDVAVSNPINDGFISDWNCCHPLQGNYLDFLSSIDHNDNQIQDYQFYEDHAEISNIIEDFHRQNEKVDLLNSSIICGDGSTPIITAFLFYLIEKGVREVFYIPPLYYNVYFILKLLGIKLRPLSKLQAFEEGFDVHLPNKKIVMMFSDPIWYAGRSTQAELINEIQIWQEKTGSTIFVDGSFQFMNWGLKHFEHTSQLDPAKTIRLICPSKALAVHGFRFSYAIVPNSINKDVRRIYNYLHGSSAFHSLRFAKNAMTILNNDNSNYDLISYIALTYERLLSKSVIEETIKPDSGYFVFCKVNPALDFNKSIAMDGKYFEQSRFPGSYRVNLLSPFINRIM